MLDNTVKSNKIEDVVFWYKAKVDRKFKIGCKELWEHHRRNYNPKHDEPIEDSMKLKKRNKNSIPVKVVKTDSEGRKKKE